jgi:hypothetical protein
MRPVLYGLVVAVVVGVLAALAAAWVGVSGIGGELSRHPECLSGYRVEDC